MLLRRDPDAHDETRKKGPPSQSTRNKLIQPEGGVNPIALQCFSPWAGIAWKHIRGQRPELSQLSAAYLSQTERQHSMSALSLREALMSTLDSKEI
jgi:hypothetical protein